MQDFTVDSPSTCEERTADPVDEPDLRFVNLRNPGAILITKTAKDFSAESGSSPLAGVDFTVTDSQGAEVAGSPVTTDANGQACIGGLTVGETYSVTESGVPAGFQLPDPRPAEDVTISDDATCDTPASVPDTASFTNDPLSEIEVNFTSLAGNRTAATIDCTGANGALTATPEDDTPDNFDDTSETFTNLKEGTYNCTVVIDP